MAGSRPDAVRVRKRHRGLHPAARVYHAGISTHSTRDRPSADADIIMSDDAPPAPRSWGVVVGLTVVATVSVILLEGLAFLTPPLIGLGVSVTVLSLLALWLASPRREAARVALRLTGPGLQAGEYIAGACVVGLVVLSSAIILGDRLKDNIDIPEMLRAILDDQSLVNRLRLVGVIVLLGPVGEELALRGWLQGQLERRWNVSAAVLTAGVAFAVMHGVDARLFYFVILGVMFGAAVVAFRTLWAGIALHMTVNAMVVIPMFIGEPPKALAPDARPDASPWIGVAGLLLAVLLYGRWLRAGARRRATPPSPTVAVAVTHPTLD
jgi:membrane protease YdiL (CAAX protease family)